MKTPIKYVGSKSSLFDKINSYVPKNVKVVVECFAGSGAFSFQKRLPFCLNDNQPELINFFQILMDAPQELIQELSTIKGLHSKSFFLNSRGVDREPDFLTSMTSVERAARYYYILYAGYNGLYRVNKNNQCNTPYGGDSRKFSLDIKKLEDASNTLRDNCVGLSCKQFDDITPLVGILDIGSRPFVLIDPPYADGDNGKKVYREYTDDIIDQKFYQRIDSYLEKLDSFGVPFLLTNTHCEFILDTFSKWKIDKVETSYKVAADKTKRGIKYEAFISNRKK